MKDSKETTPLFGKGEDVVDLGREFRELSSMAIQVSLATVARIALTSIDSAFLGHLGTEELAASSLAQVWTSTPLMGVWAAASSLITLCGQAYGAGNMELVGVWLQFGIIVTSVLSIPVFIWYWCCGYLLELSTSDAEVVRLGTIFAKVLSLSIWPSLIYACLRQYFQSMGIMAPTTVVGTMSIAVAIGANYVLIYGCFGWGGFGFAGSPLATVVASWFQPIALITWTIVIKKYHRTTWYGWNMKALTMDRLATFLALAGPIAINSLVSNMAAALICMIAARMGSDIIASNAIILGLWSLLWAFFWGYGCASQVRVANYLGANKPQSARKLALMGFFCTGVTCLLLALMTLLVDKDLFRIYTNDPHMLELCQSVLYLFVLGFLLESAEIAVSAVLTGMSEVRIIFWTSSLGTWLIDLPVCYVLGIVYEMGLPAIWISLVTMEVFKLTIYLVKYFSVDWRVQALKAAKAMEATPESKEEVERESLAVITSSVGSKPTGYLNNLPSPTTPLSSKVYEEERLSTLKPDVKRRASEV